MEKLTQLKKTQGLRLSENDKKILLEYNNVYSETLLKPTPNATVTKNFIRFS